MKGNDMTHQDQSTGELDPVQLILKHGLDGMRPAMELLLNLAMKAERASFLGAEPYERSSEREGYANGYKPKTLNTGLGKLQLDIPQSRGTAVPFSCVPQVLQKEFGRSDHPVCLVEYQRLRSTASVVPYVSAYRETVSNV
jgi:hypothetical protein